MICSLPDRLRSPWRFTPVIFLVLLFAAGCATGQQVFREGEQLMQEGRSEEGLQRLEQAVREQPGNLHYRTAYIRYRDAHIARLTAQADLSLQAGRLDEAEAQFKAILSLHPENPRAPTGLAAVATARRNNELAGKAAAAIGRDESDTARQHLRAVLAQDPDHPQANQLQRQVDEKAGKLGGMPSLKLSAIPRQTVSLEFRDAPLRTVFDAISRQSGINFVFDKDVRLDLRTTVYSRNTALGDAIDMLLATSQLAKKVVNANTLLVYPHLPIKQKEYEDRVVRVFFLANIDAKSALNLVKTMTRSNDIHVDERLNLLFVRDTPEVVRVVDEILKLADQADPEVMLEVEILEVTRSKLQELGVQWPNQLSVLTPEAITTANTNAAGAIVTTTTPAGRLTIRGLRGVGWGDLGVSPNPQINLRKEDSDVNLLANPRIRVRNKEKAKIHIGDKVPVITSNVTSTGVTSESVSYLEVGLKLDVEPQVHLDGEVGMKVGLEVSNIVREVKSANGTLTYQLGSRNATTVLRLKDGETQVLAGLISDEDRSGASKVPGLGDLPILGRLFSSHRGETKKTEIVLLITPRILRNLVRPELGQAEFFVGTEDVVTTRQLMSPSGMRRRSMIPPVMPPVPPALPQPGDPIDPAMLEAQEPNPSTP